MKQISPQKIKQINDVIAQIKKDNLVIEKQNDAGVENDQSDNRYDEYKANTNYYLSQSEIFIDANKIKPSGKLSLIKKIIKKIVYLMGKPFFVRQKDFNFLLHKSLISLSCQVDNLVKLNKNNIIKINEELSKIDYQINKKIDSIDNKQRQLENQTLKKEQIKPLEDWIQNTRDELFFEIKNTRVKGQLIHPQILNFKKYNQQVNKNNIKLNLGCGVFSKDGYLNIDSRKLDNVDILADVRFLPFDLDSVSKIYSSHLIEHFTELYLLNELLPYWYSLLKDAGKIVLKTPDIGSMIEQYKDGKISYDELRKSIFGAQDYANDYHFSMFTTESLQQLLSKVGFKKIKIMEKAVRNGLCLEMKLEAQK